MGPAEPDAGRFRGEIDENVDTVQEAIAGDAIADVAFDDLHVGPDAVERRAYAVLHIVDDGDAAARRCQRRHHIRTEKAAASGDGYPLAAKLSSRRHVEGKGAISKL